MRVAGPAALCVALSLLGAGDAAAQTRGCDRDANPGTLGDAIGAAQDGQTICLASGDYGTFEGTDKAITLKAARGADARMGFNLGEGDRGFTLDGLRFHGRGEDRFSAIVGDVRNVTFKNSRFTVPTFIDGPIESGILFDRNRFVGIDELPGDMVDSGLDLRYGAQCTREQRSGITVRNSLFADGSFTGIKTGCGIDIINNTFSDICENLELAPEGHTDNIMLAGAAGAVVRGNYFTHEGGVDRRCEAGVIAGYDGTDHVVIEDNVIVGVNRPAGIELYSDDGSIVRHNTLEATGRRCSGGARCGQIAIGSKLGTSTYEQGNDPGKDTQVYNNIAWAVSVKADQATVARNDHNMVRTGARGTANFTGTPRFVGPLGHTPKRASYALDRRSAGRSRGAGGVDVGARTVRSGPVKRASESGLPVREAITLAVLLIGLGGLGLAAWRVAGARRRPRPG
jgi:hypothetical protein